VEVHDKDNEDKKIKEGGEIDVLGNYWNWDQWQDIGDEDSIPGPPEMDHYNGPHGIKENVATSFQTILQCIFATWIDITSNSLLHNQTNMQEHKCVLSHHQCFLPTSERTFQEEKWFVFLVSC